jgi:hypothetical protein
VPNHQLANRQFVVGNLGNPIKTVPNVKVGNGPILDVALPWDDAFANVNIVKIGNRCYDIVGIDDSTYAEKSIRLRLMYNAVTSLLRKDVNGKIIIEGWWERAPVQIGPIQSISPINSIFVEKQRTPFSALPIAATDYYMFWVQITAKYDVTNPTSGDLTIYGTPVYYKRNSINEGSDTFALKTSSNKRLLSLRDVICDLTETTGIPGTDIIDISVSNQCPFSRSYSLPYTFDLTDSNGNKIEPVAVNDDKHLYKINGSSVGTYSTSKSKFTVRTKDLLAGNVCIYDAMRNKIIDVPKEYFRPSETTADMSYIEYQTSVIWDVTSLNTVVRLFYVDNDIENYIDVIIPGGHLPWVGNAWADYQAAEMNYDRELLSISIDNANKQRYIDMINSLGNSMLTVALGGAANPVGSVAGIAQMGLGIATSELQAKLEESRLYAVQNAKENYIKNSPSQNYQTGYGISYLFHNSQAFELIPGLWRPDGAGIRLETPYGIKDSDIDNYIKYRGYPCGVYASITLPEDGYIKGNIYNDFSSIGNAVETDMLRKEIASGCRIVIA